MRERELDNSSAWLGSALTEKIFRADIEAHLPHLDTPRTAVLAAGGKYLSTFSTTVKEGV